MNGFFYKELRRSYKSQLIFNIFVWCLDQVRNTDPKWVFHTYETEPLGLG